MTTTLKGSRVVFSGVNQVTVEDFIPPSGPERGHVIIRGVSSLISPGTEMANLCGTVERRFPFTPGYSYTGVVTAIGEEVEWLQSGEHVYVQAPHASHVQVPADAPSLLPIPPNVSFTDAAFTTLYAVALYASRRAAIDLGESVAILGAGLVGQLALRIVSRMGADPLVIGDLRPERLTTVLDHGADYAADLSQESVADVQGYTHQGKGFDVVMDATGSAPAVRQALALARPRGRVVLLGSPHGSVTLEDLYAELDKKDICLVGAHQPNNPQTGSLRYPWSQRRERETILRLLARGKLESRGIPFLRAGPEEAPSVYPRLNVPGEQALTCLISWGGEQ